MISRLTGKLIEKQPPQIVIDVNGVAYEANVSMQTFYNLPPLNETVQLYTQLVVREDAHLLIRLRHGRRTRDLPPTGQSKRHRRKNRPGHPVCHDRRRTGAGRGAGRRQTPLLRSRHRQKTAERMILELRGKLSGGTVSDGLFAQPKAADETDDIIGTLLALGYSDREARAAVKGIAPGTEVGEGVRLALKNLLK